MRITLGYYPPSIEKPFSKCLSKDDSERHTSEEQRQRIRERSNPFVRIIGAPMIC